MENDLQQLKKQQRAEAEHARAVAEPEVPSPGKSGGGDLDQLGAELGAEVGGTIGLPGAEPAVFGSLQSGSAWSTIKVPLTLAVIEEAGGVSDLSSDQLAQIHSALTASDNEAAAALFDYLVQRQGSVEAASQGVGRVLVAAGDSETQVSTQGRDGFSSYGQTEWALSNQHWFMEALVGGCVGDADGRQLVLNEMQQVSSDTWGLGSLGLTALWKGGWGPGTDGRYLLRQMGAVQINGQQYVVTLMVRPAGGDFETGQAVASKVAAWLAEQTENAPSASGGC